MKYVHEDGEAFGELIERAAERLDRERFTVEKDYWVTHALYALIQAGFIVWFKGGTSLSKGFSLIQRFSEDIDIKLEHPECTDVPSLVNEMKRIKLAELTAPNVPAFNLNTVPGERRVALDRAHAAIGRLFFGKRRDLDDCTEQIRTWIKEKVR